MRKGGGREEGGGEGGTRGGRGGLALSVPTAEDAGGDTDQVRQHRVREGGRVRERRGGRDEG